MSNVLIAPSILSADFGKIAKEVENIYNWGGDMVHCDVMDGVFVPNLTFGMPMIKAMKRHSKLPLDVHLMIVEPERYIVQFCDAGADFLSFHPDASKDASKALELIKSKKKKCGLVLNPDKPLSMIENYLDKLDFVVIMSVFAGFGGQKFIEESLLKIYEAKKMIDESKKDIKIVVDGGVNLENYTRIIHSGADVLVAGNAVFGASSPQYVIKKMKSS